MLSLHWGNHSVGTHVRNHLRGRRGSSERVNFEMGLCQIWNNWWGILYSKLIQNPSCIVNLSFAMSIDHMSMPLAGPQMDLISLKRPHLRAFWRTEYWSPSQDDLASAFLDSTLIVKTSSPHSWWKWPTEDARIWEWCTSFVDGPQTCGRHAGRVKDEVDGRPDEDVLQRAGGQHHRRHLLHESLLHNRGRLSWLLLSQ